MTTSIIDSLTSHMVRLIGNRIAPHGKGQGRLCILNYHRILEHADPMLDEDPDVDMFRWQMQALASSFNVMPLYDAMLALKHDRMPPRAVAITFDDGYRSTHDLALPILKEFGLPATVFVTTGYMDGNNMWNDRILEAVRRLPEGTLDLQDLGLGLHPVSTLTERKSTAGKLIEIAKYLAPEKRLELSLKLESLIGEHRSADLMLTREMVHALAQQGMEVGGHTITHPILTRLDDQRARDEITGCKEQLEIIIGKPVRLFAYPNGKVGMDFDERHVQMAKAAGYSAAFTTAMGSVKPEMDLHQIPRSRPWDNTPLLFKLRLLRWLAI
ncbi:polysaccharide deacetylase family protein [Undibacterium sp.]|jgi:peptidoglycan/xylan/chitin deacetylase (PgdA/CDA1 family)|uniref:polysaccharide deacetylase family protein n=1 Tax=Undibacterium sp. TaxID=1914977 RepID=UPI002CAD2E09|nr:polysaccharide deacetylase family protein [Undibacterium sp.]HTD05636.1 polysaccharide deacetylase family protein [Undibacterium sp.]